MSDLATRPLRQLVEVSFEILSIGAEFEQALGVKG